MRRHAETQQHLLMTELEKDTMMTVTDGAHHITSRSDSAAAGKTKR